MNTTPSFREEVYALKGPVCDTSIADMTIYCDASCAEQDGATEDALVSVTRLPGDCCAFCGKALAPGNAQESEGTNGKE